MSDEPSKSNPNEPLSLHGTTPDEASQPIFAGSPKPNAGDILAAAFEEFSASGTTQAKCDSCGSAIEFSVLSPRAWTSRCECGKFNDTLRGL